MANDVRRWSPKSGDLESLLKPTKWRGEVVVDLVPDPFAPGVPVTFVDCIFAVIASSGRRRFRVSTAHPWRALAYFERVRRGSRASMDRYAAWVRRHERSYHRERGFDTLLINPPTPELRFIYDSAQRIVPPNESKSPKRAFPAGEFHWREWPLDNVKVGPR